MSLNISQEYRAQGLTLAAARSEGGPQVASLFKRLLILGAIADFTMFSLRGKPVLASVEGSIHKNSGRPNMARSEMEPTDPKNDREDLLGYLSSGSLDWSINECVWE